jgi:hypothetical protein
LTSRAVRTGFPKAAPAVTFPDGSNPAIPLRPRFRRLSAGTVISVAALALLTGGACYFRRKNKTFADVV